MFYSDSYLHISSSLPHLYTFASVTNFELMAQNIKV